MLGDVTAAGLGVAIFGEALEEFEAVEIEAGFGAVEHEFAVQGGEGEGMPGAVLGGDGGDAFARDVGAIGEADFEAMEIELGAGVGFPEGAVHGAGGTGVEEAAVGATVEGLEDVFLDGFGFVADDEERAVAIVLAVPAFGAAGFVGGEEDDFSAGGGFNGTLEEFPMGEAAAMAGESGIGLFVDLT